MKNSENKIPEQMWQLAQKIRDPVSRKKLETAIHEANTVKGCIAEKSGQCGFCPIAQLIVQAGRWFPQESEEGEKHLQQFLTLVRLLCNEHQTSSKKGRPNIQALINKEAHLGFGAGVTASRSEGLPNAVLLFGR